MNTVGIIGCTLLLVKIILHACYKYQTDESFSMGSEQNPQRFVLLLPAFKDEFDAHKQYRIVLNVLYWVSITLIIIFLVFINIG